MSTDNSESTDGVREVEVVTRSNIKARGEVFKDLAGNAFVKLGGKQFAARPELERAVSAGEEPVTVWVQVTDKVSKQLLHEGQSLLAWVRVKQSDGKFVTKTALFSLGAVAAITITRRAIHHYKSR